MTPPSVTKTKKPSALVCSREVHWKSRHMSICRITIINKRRTLQEIQTKARVQLSIILTSNWKSFSQLWHRTACYCSRPELSTQSWTPPTVHAEAVIGNSHRFDAVGREYLQAEDSRRWHDRKRSLISEQFITMLVLVGSLWIFGGVWVYRWDGSSETSGRPRLTVIFAFPVALRVNLRWIV